MQGHLVADMRSYMHEGLSPERLPGGRRLMMAFSRPFASALMPSVWAPGP